MARAERRLLLNTKKKKKKSSQGSTRVREPLHVELLRSAGVVDADGGGGPATTKHVLQHHKRRQQQACEERVAALEGETEQSTRGTLPISTTTHEERNPTSDTDSDGYDACILNGAATTSATPTEAAGIRRTRGTPQKNSRQEVSLVPATLSKKILRLAEHQQRAADFSDTEEEDDGDDAGEDVLLGGLGGGISPSQRRSSSRLEENVDAEGYVVLDYHAADSAEEEEEELYVQRRRQRKHLGDTTITEKELTEQVGDTPATPSLIDDIFRKLEARESLQQHKFSPEPVGHDEETVVSSSVPVATDSSDRRSRLPPKVVEVYSAMAPFLQKYKSGKMPKAFKVLPRLQQWEEVLMLTQPESWSPHALAAATKIFCSNLASIAVQRFLCLVLLPAIREDITEHKKLNYHLYQALKKVCHQLLLTIRKTDREVLFYFRVSTCVSHIFLSRVLCSGGRPAFGGFPVGSLNHFLPALAPPNGCSRKEAVIVGSVVAKMSIPVLHGAAALLRLSLVLPAQWLPAVSHLMNVLINKKYSLPTKAVQACVQHFHRFRGHQEKLPVSWHRAFLSFVQRYKLVLSESDRRKLHEVLRVHCHELIGPEIRRELQAKDPAAVLSQQALLLEKRQQRLQQQQQQEGRDAAAALTPTDVEIG